MKIFFINLQLVFLLFVLLHGHVHGAKDVQCGKLTSLAPATASTIAGCLQRIFLERAALYLGIIKTMKDLLKTKDDGTRIPFLVALLQQKLAHKSIYIPSDMRELINEDLITHLGMHRDALTLFLENLTACYDALTTVAEIKLTYKHCGIVAGFMSKLTAEFKGLRRALRSKKSNGVTVLQIQQEFFFRTETKEAICVTTGSMEIIIEDKFGSEQLFEEIDKTIITFNFHITNIYRGKFSWV